MRYRARGVALLQKLNHKATVPGLAARVLVHSVQLVVQNSAPADRLAECTADWVVVFYLPCLGVDFLCNLTGDGGVAYSHVLLLRRARIDCST